MSPITLFGFPGSTYVRTARMACVEKGVPHTVAPLEFRAESHRALHPYLKMPAMDHDGFRLFETLAIVTYVDALDARTPLLPSDARARARSMQWVSAAVDYFYGDLVRVLLEDTLAEGAAQKIARDLDVVDRALAENDFFAGDRPSIADLFVAPMVAFAAGKGHGPEKRQHLARWLEAVSSRPSFTETAA
jgi:glutathione S-transferase